MVVFFGIVGAVIFRVDDVEVFFGGVLERDWGFVVFHVGSDKKCLKEGERHFDPIFNVGWGWSFGRARWRRGKTSGSFRR